MYVLQWSNAWSRGFEVRHRRGARYLAIEISHYVVRISIGKYTLSLRKWY